MRSLDRPLSSFRRRRFLAAVSAAGLAAAPLVARAADPAFTMRLGLPTAANSVFGEAAVRFARGVDRRSNGQLKVDVYPNGQLSTQQAAIDFLSSGVLDFAIEASSFLVQINPRFEVFDMPFLFKDLKSGFRVLDGPIGRELFSELEPRGIVGLGWGLNGLKEIETVSRPILVPDDMKGLRIRIQSGGVFAQTYQSMGAIPVIIDYGETFTALTQHTIDAIETPIDGIVINKWYTVLRHVALSNHVFSVAVLLGSKRKFDALPAPLQKIVREEALATVPYWRTIFSQRNGENIQTLRRVGVAITDIQFAPFRKAVEPVYASVQAKLGGDLLERISRAANA